MLNRSRSTLAFIIIALLPAIASAQEAVAKKIGWYGTLESGLEEARKTGRPILLVSAAPHCLGVPGIW